MPSRRHGALPRRRRRDQDPHVRPRSTPRQGRLRGGVLDAGSLHGRILRRQGGGQVDAREGTRAPEDPRRDSHPPRCLQPARRPFRPVFRRRRQRLHPHGALQQQDARRRRETARGLSEREVACYAREIVAAVAHLHANRVIHRDLKLGNLFLTPAGLDEAGAGPGSDPDLEEPAAGGRLKIGADSRVASIATTSGRPPSAGRPITSRRKCWPEVKEAGTRTRWTCGRSG